MKTVFVKYGTWLSGGHAMLDDEWVERGKVVEVENLLDLNKDFKHLIDVKVLDDGNENIHTEKGPFAD